MMLTALAAAAAISASCAWDAPRGTHAVTAVAPSSLVDNYRDIPAAVRARLKARMDARQYDDIAEIRRGAIAGAYAYSDLRDMHFGATGGKVCQQVTMTSWTAADVERALIYHEGGHTIAVPTICRNVSRITRGARLAPPPGPLTAEIPPSMVDPLPASADVGMPPVIGEPLEPELPPQSFARLGDPGSVNEPPAAEEPPLRISADQTWGEYWSRPLFGPLARSFLFLDSVAPVALIPGPVAPSGPVVPVPGVTPVIASSVPPIFAPLPGGLPDGSAMPASAAPIPEPGTWALMVLGLGWLAYQRRGREA
jgi:hypothetical protein